MLWDLNEGKHLYTLDGGDVINALCFSPNRYWLCAATGPSIKIWVREATIDQSVCKDWPRSAMLASSDTRNWTCWKQQRWRRLHE